MTEKTTTAPVVVNGTSEAKTGEGDVQTGASASTDQSSAKSSAPVDPTAEDKPATDDPSPMDPLKDDSSSTKNGKVKKPRQRPRVLKSREQGIYTISELEKANFFVEWNKGLRASGPFIIRLAKTYWDLSPARALVLVFVHLLDAVVPSAFLFVQKGFLDEVQRTATGGKLNVRKLVLLSVLSVLREVFHQTMDVIKYGFRRSGADGSDRVHEVMESRMRRLLRNELVESHLRLDPDQLTDRKISRMYSRVWLCIFN
jgi:hypothetical protein